MNHKRSLLLAGAMTLSILLAACGTPQANASPSQPSPAASDQESQFPPPTEPAELVTPSQPASEAPSASEPEPSESQAADTEAMKELAMTFIDKSVEELIDAIGEPSGTDYAPSCLGSGEDGELFYDGFSVYTYREGNTETVKDVL